MCNLNYIFVFIRTHHWISFFNNRTVINIFFTELAAGDAAEARTGGGVECSRCHWLVGVSVTLSVYNPLVFSQETYFFLLNIFKDVCNLVVQFKISGYGKMTNDKQLS